MYAIDAGLTGLLVYGINSEAAEHYPVPTARRNQAAMPIDSNVLQLIHMACGTPRRATSRPLLLWIGYQSVR